MDTKVLKQLKKLNIDASSVSTSPTSTRRTKYGNTYDENNLRWIVILYDENLYYTMKKSPRWKTFYDEMVGHRISQE